MKPKVVVRFDFCVDMGREHRRNVRRRPYRGCAGVAVVWARRWAQRTLKNVPGAPGAPYGNGIACNVWLSDDQADYFVRNKKALRVELTW